MTVFYPSKYFNKLLVTSIKKSIPLVRIADKNFLRVYKKFSKIPCKRLHDVLMTIMQWLKIYNKTGFIIGRRLMEFINFSIKTIVVSILK